MLAFCLTHGKIYSRQRGLLQDLHVELLKGCLLYVSSPPPPPADIIDLFKWGGGREDWRGSSICQCALCTGSRVSCPTCVLGSELRPGRTQRSLLKVQLYQLISISL